MKETTEEDIRIKLEAEVNIHNLENRVTSMENRVTSIEKTINILTILCNEYAKKNGMKIEKYPNGVVVISQT